jgi:hypothetical protein
VSAGWAWQCDDCDRTQIQEVNDYFERPSRVVPLYWSQTTRRVSDTGGPDSVRVKYFCDICSDGKNL